MSWQIQSIIYSLEELAKSCDFVIMDSSALNNVGGRITEKMYKCYDELLMDNREL